MFFSHSQDSDAPASCVPIRAIKLFQRAADVASHALEKHDARLRETMLHHHTRESMSMELERQSQERFRAVAGV
jgi:hypothetical protein